MTGRTIRIFLADGEPTGILLAEISNWTCKVLVAPRSQLDQLSKREEIRRTGLYLLVGPDPDDPPRALAYIGEGDSASQPSPRHLVGERTLGGPAGHTLLPRLLGSDLQVESPASPRGGRPLKERGDYAPDVEASSPS